MKKSLFLALSLGLLAASCQTGEEPMPVDPAGGQRMTQTREVIITAQMENDASETRTALLTEDGVEHVYWSPGDKIKVFSAGEAAMFTSTNDSPARKAKFKGVVSMIMGDDGESGTDYVWGLYPYRDDATYEEPDGPWTSATAVITTTLPDLQQGKAGSFADNTAVMIGRSESLTLSYKNAYSGLMVKFGRDDITSITMRGRHGEALAGRFALGLDSGLSPVVKAVIDGKTAVTLVAPNGQTFTPGENYFIVTLPDVALQEGYSVTLTRTDGMEATFNSLTTVKSFNRNKFQNYKNAIDSYIEIEGNISSGRSTGWVQSTTQGPDEIWYTSTDNAVVEYAVDGATGNEVVSNTYANGKGVIRFGSILTEVDKDAFESKSTLKTVSIPDEVETIADKAFSGCTNLTAVNFGTGLKTIGGSAFYNCYNLESVILPDGLQTVGNAAFAVDTEHLIAEIGYSKLASVSIPESVTEIYPDAFAYNASLKTINLPKGTKIYSNPFAGCKSLESFTGENDFIADGGRALISSGRWFFALAPGGLTSYSVPEGVETVDGYAMAYLDNLNEIEFPKSLKTLYPSALMYDNLTKITLRGVETDLFEKPSDDVFASDYEIRIPGAGASYYTNSSTPYWSSMKDHFVVYQADNEIWFHQLEDSTDGRYLPGDYNGDGNNDEWIQKAFFPGHALRCEPSVPSYPGANFPVICILYTPALEAISQMADYGFSDEHPGTSVTKPSAPEIDYVSLPKTVTAIGAKAFKGCSNLRNFPILYEATGQDIVIFDDAFNGCSSMEYCNGSNKKIFLNTTSIGARAFKGCSSVKRFSTNATAIGEETFNGCSELSIFSTSGSVNTIKKGMFQDCHNLEQVVLNNPGRVITIGTNAFRECNKLAKLGTESASGIELPSVVGIGDGAFYNCDAIVSMTLPKITSIGETAFAFCDGLVSATLGQVGQICNQAFLACINLAKITLTVPEQLTAIGNAAFVGCSNLKTINNGVGENEVDLPGVTSIGYHAFENTGIEKLYLHKVPGLDNEDLAGMGQLKYLHVPLLKTLGGSALSGCGSLTSLELPCIINLNDNALTGSYVTALTLGGELTTIGAYAIGGVGVEGLCVTFLGQAPPTTIDDNAFKKPSLYGSPEDYFCSVFVPADAIEAYSQSLNSVGVYDVSAIE